MKKIKFFRLNGKHYFINETITILNLLTYLNLNNSIIIIEYNNIICKEQKWKKTVIENYPKIEFITIVGGG